MKKLFVLIGLFAVLAGTVFAQELPRLAVVEFSTNISNERILADAVTVRNLVESQMVATRLYEIVTRTDIDQLIANQRIQISEIASRENIQRLELANIQYIITGSLDAMGNYYAITVRVLNVATGQFSHSDNEFMGSGSRDMFDGINILMTRFNAGMAGVDGRVVQTGPGGRAAANRVFEIGDTGPAGGIIFHDKGFVSDGWRFLEAAPANAAFTAQWGAFGQNVAGTQTDIGSGRRNTELIVDRLRQLGENQRAAQISVGMEINGFNDWFLPSRDELNLMFRNLAQRGLGGFGNRWYWSSSQATNLDAWVQHFGGGRQTNLDKIGTPAVRAIRAF